MPPHAAPQPDAAAAAAATTATAAAPADAKTAAAAAAPEYSSVAAFVADHPNAGSDEIAAVKHTIDVDEYAREIVERDGLRPLDDPPVVVCECCRGYGGSGDDGIMSIIKPPGGGDVEYVCEACLGELRARAVAIQDELDRRG